MRVSLSGMVCSCRGVRVKAGGGRWICRTLLSKSWGTVGNTEAVAHLPGLERLLGTRQRKGLLGGTVRALTLRPVPLSPPLCRTMPPSCSWL